MDKLLERLDNLISLGEKNSFEDFSSREMNKITLEILKELKEEQLSEEIKVGDKVQYSKKWLQSTATHTGDLPRAKGTVKKIEKMGQVNLAVIDWDKKDIPKKVNVKNLNKIGSIVHEELLDEAKWEKPLPKGWTPESREKFAKSLTGKTKGSPEGFVKACIAKMEGKVDDAGAFCASLKDRYTGTTKWRGED